MVINEEGMTLESNILECHVTSSYKKGGDTYNQKPGNPNRQTNLSVSKKLSLI